MENLTLPLKLSRNYYKNRKRTNLNLDKDLTKACGRIAAERYGYSLSEMVNQLLKIERSHKIGILNRRLHIERKF